jgi:hypothetical protein
MEMPWYMRNAMLQCMLRYVISSPIVERRLLSVRNQLGIIFAIVNCGQQSEKLQFQMAVKYEQLWFCKVAVFL